MEAIRLTLDVIIQFCSVVFATNGSPSTPFSVTIARGKQKHLKSYKRALAAPTPCKGLTWKHSPAAPRSQDFICVEVLQELWMAVAQLPAELGVPLIFSILEAAFPPLPQIGRTGSKRGFASLGNLGISIL